MSTGPTGQDFPPPYADTISLQLSGLTRELYKDDTGLHVREVLSGLNKSSIVSWFIISPDLISKESVETELQSTGELDERLKSSMKLEDRFVMHSPQEAAAGWWREILPDIKTTGPGIRQFELKKFDNNHELRAFAVVSWNSKTAALQIALTDSELVRSTLDRDSLGKPLVLTKNELDSFLLNHIKAGPPSALAEVGITILPLRNQSAQSGSPVSVGKEVRFPEGPDTKVSEINVSGTWSRVSLIREKAGHQVDVTLAIAHSEYKDADRVAWLRRCSIKTANKIVETFDEQRANIESSDRKRRNDGIVAVYSYFSRRQNAFYDSAETSRHPMAKEISNIVDEIVRPEKFSLVEFGEKAGFYKANVANSILDGETEVSIKYCNSPTNVIGLDAVSIRYNQGARHLSVRLVPTLRDELGNAYVDVEILKDVGLPLKPEIAHQIQRFVTACATVKFFPEDPSALVSSFFGQVGKNEKFEMAATKPELLLAFRNIRWAFASCMSLQSKIHLSLQSIVPDKRQGKFSLGDLRVWEEGGESGYGFLCKLLNNNSQHYLQVKASASRITVTEELGEVGNSREHQVGISPLITHPEDVKKWLSVCLQRLGRSAA